MDPNGNGQVPSDVAHVETVKANHSTRVARETRARTAPDRSGSRLEAPKGEGVWLEIFRSFNRGRVSNNPIARGRGQSLEQESAVSQLSAFWNTGRLEVVGSANYFQTRRHSSWKCGFDGLCVRVQRVLLVGGRWTKGRCCVGSRCGCGGGGGRN